MGKREKVEIVITYKKRGGKEGREREREREKRRERVVELDIT